MYSQRKSGRAVIAGATILLLSGAAHAQSSVTLYGVADGGLLYTSKTLDPATGGNAGKQFSLVDSGIAPSQFGLMGTEDLGGGMKAEFRLESGISVANGSFNDSNGNLFGRQAYVGLANPYGEVKLGLQFSPFFLALYDLDPRGLSQFGSGLVIYLDHVAGTGVFNANSVSYSSPVVAGFSGSALFSFGGVAGNFQSGRQYSVSLKYDNGTVMVEAAYYDGNSGGTVSTVPPTNVAFEGRMLGASYKIGKLTAKASFVNYKVAGGFNSNVYDAGLDFLATPDLDLNGGVWFVSDRNQTTNHSVMGSLGAQYFLTRRTTLYGQVAVVNNHGAMNTGLSVNDALYSPTGTTTGVNCGIRHVF
ncbi:Outer membrane porin protein 32 [Paraburkholderia caffeinitolerans]|uniref:Outer membrane porin protein 32 n=1 Tax=Paraburkholderia caffeinitolerans TaxID=1723730 RepID=A0A6J5G2E5_9BURK|nr:MULTISPECIES: porin [Paraburkholderia]CAB3788584.1 Outer membrane porin protein 32 [Paraburkholderia caffeinitolerans]